MGIMVPSDCTKIRTAFDTDAVGTTQICACHEDEMDENTVFQEYVHLFEADAGDVILTCPRNEGEKFLLPNR